MAALFRREELTTSGPVAWWIRRPQMKKFFETLRMLALLNSPLLVALVLALALQYFGVDL